MPNVTPARRHQTSHQTSRHPAATILVALAVATACSGEIDGRGLSGSAPASTPRNSGSTTGAPGGPGGGLGNPSASAPGGAPSNPSNTTGSTPTGPGSSAPAGPQGALLDPSRAFACPAGARPAAQPRVWRLSAEQYRATVAALAPGFATVKTANPFEGIATTDRFSNYSNAGMPGALVEASVRAAGEIADALIPKLQAEAPCLTMPDSACLRDAATRLGARAFRRPLLPEEIDRYTALGTANLTALGASGAFRLMVQAFLNSPHFLFRTELGEATADVTGRSKLTGYELASALAYTLTDAPPDEGLLAPARAGTLGNPDELRRQATRLIGTPGENRTIARFFREYLHYERTLEVFRDKKTYPFHSPPDLLADTDAFIKTLLASRKNFVSDLFTAGWGFASKATTGSYGLPASPSATPARIDYPAGQRSGILTQPSFLSGYSEGEETDPIRRGRFIAESLLCQVIPAIPPEGVPPLADMPSATMRERLAVHRAVSSNCAVCHNIMDPPGLALEGYDHVGRHRPTDKNKPLDLRGVLDGSGAMTDGPYNGAIELSRKLAASPVVAQCLVRHGFRFWYGRGETEADGCSLSAAQQAMDKAGGDPLEMVLAFVTSDSFIYRTAAK